MHLFLSERFEHVRHLPHRAVAFQLVFFRCNPDFFNSSSDSASRWWPPDAEFFGGVLVDFAFLSSAVEAADRCFFILFALDSLS